MPDPSETERDRVLRADIAAFDPLLEVIWVGDLVGAGNLEAIVQDLFGQYRFPWLKTAAETCGSPYTDGIGRPSLRNPLAVITHSAGPKKQASLF